MIQQGIFSLRVHWEVGELRHLTILVLPDNREKSHRHHTNTSVLGFPPGKKKIEIIEIIQVSPIVEYQP